MSSAEQLSHELRLGSDDVLQRRRMVAGLTLLTISSMGVMTLYQIALVATLATLPLAVPEAIIAFRRLRPGR